MISAVLAIGGLALFFGLILGYAAVRFKVEEDQVVDKVDSLLPQTQCGQCGYPGCRPYAEAIAADEADINLCPPGGEGTMLAIADLLGREPQPMGEDEDGAAPAGKVLAVIDEEWCIGCTLCLRACPVDAIAGASKQLHTVIADECTGCTLCVEPCPTDCITMESEEVRPENWEWPYPGNVATG